MELMNLGSPRSRPGDAVRSGQRRRHRIVGWLLVVFVVIVHGCVGREVARGMALRAAPPAPRIEVAFVRQMEVSTAPPPAARAAAPQEQAPAVSPPSRVRRRIPAPRPASSPHVDPVPGEAVATEAAAAADVAAAASAAGADTALASAAEESAAASAPTASAASAAAGTDPAQAPDASSASARGPSLAAATPAAAPDSAADAALAAFDWPVSTRVSFLLTGNYRGEVSGSANVEWIRVGAHYQVHLDLLVGPSFAPVITRRMTSDGEITAAGLAPRRYDQETRVMGMDRAPVTMRFDPEGGGVVLANGNRVAGRPGVQDTASQFIQLSYVFGTHPEKLRIGGTVDIPLALPHKVDVWTYDVVGEEILATPFGPLAAIRLTPRRKSERGDELTAEIWFAPQLRYLPARIRMQQGESSYLDLMIDRQPVLAGS